MHMNMKRIVQGLALAVLMSGGNATANIILLGTSAIVAIGGTAYLARKHAR